MKTLNAVVSISALMITMSGITYAATPLTQLQNVRLDTLTWSDSSSNGFVNYYYITRPINSYNKFSFGYTFSEFEVGSASNIISPVFLEANQACSTGLNVELNDGTNVELKLEASSTIDAITNSPKTLYEFKWGSSQNSVWTPKIDTKKFTKEQAVSRHSFDLKVKGKNNQYTFTPTVDNNIYPELTLSGNIKHINIRTVNCYTPAGIAFPNALRMQHKVIEVRWP